MLEIFLFDLMQIDHPNYIVHVGWIMKIILFFTKKYKDNTLICEAKKKNK